MLPIPCQLRVLTNIPPADKKIKEPFRTPLFFLRRERDSRAPTSLRSPTSNAHTLPRASCATQNEEVAEQLSFLYLSTFPFNKLMSMCLYTKNEPYRTRSSFWLAEREGFEPPEPLSSTVFKTAAIDHSAISPSSQLARKKKLTLRVWLAAVAPLNSGSRSPRYIFYG